VLRRLRRLRDGAGDPKGDAELSWWRARLKESGPLEEFAHLYRFYFLDHFRLGEDFYAGKRLLDIGCGPRGSLTWAGGAAERIGVDPLVSRYRELQQGNHGMNYVEAGAEHMPFADGYFDVVSSINSLDHVDDVDRAIAEATRVAKPGGTFLLLVDVGHEPTPTEPHALDWTLPERFSGWAVAERRDYERPSDNMYDNLLADRAFDHADPTPRAGVLSVRFTRDAPAPP
jgi:SAM-dependent methyltransferase